MLGYVIAVLAFAAAGTRVADILLPDEYKKAIDEAASRLSVRLEAWKRQAALVWVPSAVTLHWSQKLLSLVFGFLLCCFFLWSFYLTLSALEADIFRSVILKVVMFHIVQVAVITSPVLIFVRTYRHYLLVAALIVIANTLVGLLQYQFLGWWFGGKLSRDLALTTVTLAIIGVAIMFTYTWTASIFRLASTYLALGLLEAIEFVVRRICLSSKGALFGIAAIVALGGAFLGFFVR